MTDQEPQANRALARLLAQRYAQALRDADSVAAEEAIEVALQAGFDGAAICSRVIAPAMRWIGDLWERDSISVADEHLATAITHHLLGRLQASLFPPPHRTEAATALLACAEGEQHTLGLSMIADVLRSRGWRVLELGASVPTKALMAALDRHSPHLVGFSATMSWSIPSLAHALERIAEAQPRARVILGEMGSRSACVRPTRGRARSRKRSTSWTPHRSWLRDRGVRLSFPTAHPQDRSTELVAAFRGRMRRVDAADGFVDLQVWQSDRARGDPHGGPHGAPGEPKPALPERRASLEARGCPSSPRVRRYVATASFSMIRASPRATNRATYTHPRRFLAEQAIRLAGIRSFSGAGLIHWSKRYWAGDVPGEAHRPQAGSAPVHRSSRAALMPLRLTQAADGVHLKLYVCWGTFPVPWPRTGHPWRPSAHPCKTAYDALKEAGYSLEVVKCYGLGRLPDVTSGRKDVKRLTGESWVPVLLLDDGEVIKDSTNIVAWARDNPAAGTPA